MYLDWIKCKRTKMRLVRFLDSKSVKQGPVKTANSGSNAESVDTYYYENKNNALFHAIIPFRHGINQL